MAHVRQRQQRFNSSCCVEVVKQNPHFCHLGKVGGADRDCSDHAQGEQQKLSYYHRNLARQQQQLAQWLQKRCANSRHACHAVIRALDSGPTLHAVLTGSTPKRMSRNHGLSWLWGCEGLRRRHCFGVSADIAGRSALDRAAMCSKLPLVGHLLSIALCVTRRQENMARRAAGEDELSEDVPAQFKPPPEPSQLDYFLIANQISNYCDQVRRLL